MDRNTIPINGTVHNRGNAKKNPIPDEELPPEIRKYLRTKEVNYYKEPDAIDRLEGKHVVRILLFISRMSPVIKTDIYTHVSRSNGVRIELDNLEELGMIEIIQTAHTNTNVIRITDKGRKLAEVLLDAVSICEDAIEEIKKAKIECHKLKILLQLRTQKNVLFK